MKAKVERRTVVVTTYELDLSTLNMDFFKQELENIGSEWIAEQFDTVEELYNLMKSDTDIASELFNLLNNSDFGKKDEYFLDGEEYSIQF
jgi:hypothetical protein